MNTAELLQILACPRCHGDLRIIKNNTAPERDLGFACDHCELLYPIRDEIPVMLIEEALPLAEAEKELKAGSKVNSL